MDHIPKMLRFEVMQLFQIPLTAAGGSLASSLRFALLADNCKNYNENEKNYISEARFMEQSFCFDPNSRYMN